jgi:D-tyrosyl-tRNA(Tyr) deacylase
VRALIQRVKEASVSIDGCIHSAIGPGFLIFLGIHRDDTAAQLPWVIQKIVTLRCFSDHAGKMNLSIGDIQGAILVVSQFTLYANCCNGRRPDFLASAPPAIAEPLYEQFIVGLQSSIREVRSGKFGADMQISLINDGPVTFMIDTP